MGSNVVLQHRTAFSSRLKSVQLHPALQRCRLIGLVSLGENNTGRKKIYTKLRHWGRNYTTNRATSVHLLIRKHPVMEPVSVKRLTQVCTHTRIQKLTHRQRANTCSLRQHTELVLDLSSLIKPIRMILCTDEDNLAILVVALSHMPMQLEEDVHILNYIICNVQKFNRN